jgi:hypothetical protein
VTLTVGGTAAATFGTAAVSGSNRFNKGTTDTCSGFTLQVGQTCTIRINFNGSGTASRTGTLTVPYNGSLAPAILNLTGS